jgi:hypothetical protein
MREAIGNDMTRTFYKEARLGLRIAPMAIAKAVKHARLGLCCYCEGKSVPCQAKTLRNFLPREPSFVLTKFIG